MDSGPAAESIIGPRFARTLAASGMHRECRFRPPLPIDEALAPLTAALRANNCAVLVAPPGAGKTTRVPLVLLDEPWAKDKKILVLEPRRLAARAAAARMASTLKEQVGDTVGLRVRFGSKVQQAHAHRSGDRGRVHAAGARRSFARGHRRRAVRRIPRALAGCRSRARAGARRATGLRDDLKILVMSATLDGARVAALLGDAPVIESQGRSFPVETRYLGRDAARAHRGASRDAAERALRAESRLAAGVSAGRRRNPPHRNAAERARARSGGRYRGALRRARSARAGPCHCPGAAGPAQGGAGDLDRGDLAHHRGRAGGDRQRAFAGAALRAGRRLDAAGDGARLARRLRPAHAAAPAAPNPASAIAYGTSRRPVRWSPIRGRKFCPPICRLSCSIWRNGARAIRARFACSTRRRHPRSTKRASCCASWAPSTQSAASPRKAAACARCRCRRGWRAWWWMRRARVQAKWPPRSPPSSPSAGWAVTIPTCATGWTNSAATARAAPRMRGRWRGGGRLSVIPGRRRRRTPYSGVTARSIGIAGPGPLATVAGDDARVMWPARCFALAFPDRIAKNRGGGNGAFLLANGRGGAVDAASPLAREPFLAWLS